ncbi:hypothetical protein MBLNU459_g0589t2 [Dothideomycetes sp. NU459]
MSFARSALRRSFLRPFLAAPRAQQQQLPRTSLRFASGDYGSGEGSPVGENPQDQGSNPSADLEHPGPPPPKDGQGTGGGPTKGSSSGNNTSEAAQNGGKNSSGGSSGKSATSSDSSSGGSSSSSKKEGAQPKIFSESPPAPEQQSDEVKEHNRQMDNRAEQADTKIDADHGAGDKDKVGKDFS